MSIYKRIKPSSVKVYELETNKLFNLTNNDTGVNSVQYRSASLEDDGVTFTESGSYWNSLLVNFYLSGSHRDTISSSKYFGLDFGSHDTVNPQHKNKFHSSGSVIFIPQHYFGEGIQKESLVLTSGDVVLKDDGYGNLYSTTLTHTSSADTSISSSLNYKGNVFYDYGVVAITDTGSYGGVNYSHLTTGSFNLDFNSIHTIFMSEHEIKVNPNEFNSTSNISVRQHVSGGIPQYSSPILKNNLTSSGWSPFMNTIGFYQESDTEPVMVARYSQPIKMRDDITLIFRVRMDY